MDSKRIEIIKCTALECNCWSRGALRILVYIKLLYQEAIHQLKKFGDFQFNLKRFNSFADLSLKSQGKDVMTDVCVTRSYKRFNNKSS